MPRWVVTLWFVSFMFTVLLVMLNMLLAILLERHSEVADILSTRRDARTICVQSWRWLKRKRDSFGFIPLNKIRLQLESDVYPPVHNENLVNEQSLLTAFPG